MSQTFSSRWGMMLAMLGMAVGTGNIWRFPRIAAANGGGSFLVAWVVFLLLWSVPLLLVEFAMGKATRYGTVGAFTTLLGKRFAWMGAWVAFTATAIMFYYSVVAGWTIRYFWAGVTGELGGEIPGALWSDFAGSGWAVLTHALAMGIGVWVVARGVRGIEQATRILIPSLFFLVILLALRAVTLPGAEDGLAFLFTPQWSELTNARIWLEALTQNAWDTGAGWGAGAYLRNLHAPQRRHRPQLVLARLRQQLGQLAGGDHGDLHGIRGWPVTGGADRGDTRGVRAGDHRLSGPCG